MDECCFGQDIVWVAAQAGAQTCFARGSGRWVKCDVFAQGSRTTRGAAVDTCGTDADEKYSIVARITALEDFPAGIEISMHH
jgi:hypothetical protein